MMNTLIFPIVVSKVLIIWGLITLFLPKLGNLILTKFNQLPIRTLGVLWLLMIGGLFVSSYLAYDPMSINLIGAILVFDAISLIFMPNYVVQVTVLYKKMSAVYKMIYGGLSVLLGVMILWQFYLPIKDLVEKSGLA